MSQEQPSSNELVRERMRRILFDEVFIDSRAQDYKDAAVRLWAERYQLEARIRELEQGAAVEPKACCEDAPEGMHHPTCLNIGSPVTRAVQPPSANPSDLVTALAHRAVGNQEQDMQNGKLAGYCIVCQVPWPCDTAKHYLRPVQPPETKQKEWRCFHCDEVCVDEASAREHFGVDRHCDPICKVSRAEYRRMEIRHIQYTLEDTELHLALAAKTAEMTREVRKAEEDGYSKGLQDGRATVPPVVGDQFSATCQGGSVLGDPEMYLVVHVPPDYEIALGREYVVTMTPVLTKGSEHG